MGAQNSSLSPGEKGASLPVTLEPHGLDLGGSTYTWIVLNKYTGRFLFLFLFGDLQQFEKILRRIFYFGRCFGDARPFEKKKLADETLYLLNHMFFPLVYFSGTVQYVTPITQNMCQSTIDVIGKASGQQ